jgi:hypothetical protein
MGHSISSIGLSANSVADAVFQGKPELSAMFMRGARQHEEAPEIRGFLSEERTPTN